MFGKQPLSGELLANKESTLFSNLAICYFIIVKREQSDLKRKIKMTKKLRLGF